MSPTSPPADPWPRLLFGAAYYPEYRPQRSIEDDLDLMKHARFTVIRVGESVWSTWEPENGKFDLDWLKPVLDAAQARGISAILGTPTYAIPPWLQKQHPELAAEISSSMRVPWGSRQEVDFTEPAFRYYAERLIRKVLEVYAGHPAVIGFQVDNEPGLHLLNSRRVFQEFVGRLRARYGTIQNLNEAWGLAYWSHRLNSFDELWGPEGNSFPQFDLAWRRFQADLTTEFIVWQAELVREYSRTDQFITTCLAYPRRALDDANLSACVDVVAGNPYFVPQDGLTLGQVTNSPDFAVSGVGPFFRQADRMWAGRHQRFLVTETNAQTIGPHSENRPPHPGQLRQAALALVSRGACMIEYWQWQTPNHGPETYWGGILPHSGRPGRTYGEVADIGRSLERIGPALQGYVPDADVAVVFSNASKWALEFLPPLQTDDGVPDPASYLRIFDAYHTGVVEAGRQAVIVHDTQLTGIDPKTFATQHPVLIAPALYIVGDSLAAWLRRYALGGGHLVLGVRTGYADERGWAREAIAPPGLADLAGVTYEEFSNINADIAVEPRGSLCLSTTAAGSGWIDGLLPDGADVLAAYDHAEWGRFPAMTSHGVGSGRVTYVGTVPNAAFARDIVSWLTPSHLSSGWTFDPPGAVTVQSGVAQGVRLSFVSNWSGAPAVATSGLSVRDLESGAVLAAGSSIALDSRGVRVFVNEGCRVSERAPSSGMAGHNDHDHEEKAVS